MIGTILVEGLEIECIVGIYPHEREIPQLLLVDVDIDHEIGEAVESEKVDATVDYVDLAEAITALAVDGRYQLLETFASDGCDLLIKRFGASRARVKVMKPAAVPAASWAAVQIEKRA